MHCRRADGGAALRVCAVGPATWRRERHRPAVEVRMTKGRTPANDEVRYAGTRAGAPTGPNCSDRTYRCSRPGPIGRGERDR